MIEAAEPCRRATPDARIPTMPHAWPRHTRTGRVPTSHGYILATSVTMDANLSGIPGRRFVCL